LSVRENPLSKPELVESVANWIFDNSTFWAWEEDGAIQGFSAADPRDGTIFALFVHPSYEGRGIGRALLPMACQILRDNGHAIARLTTAAGTRRTILSPGRLDRDWRKDDGQIVFQKAL